MLGDPEVVSRLEVAHRDDPLARADRKLAACDGRTRARAIEQGRASAPVKTEREWDGERAQSGRSAARRRRRAPSGLQLTDVAARCSRRITSVGFHSPSLSSHTYAFRSCDELTIRLVLAAQSRPVMSASCSRNVHARVSLGAPVGPACTL
jgi:hypothetical protein